MSLAPPTPSTLLPDDAATRAALHRYLEEAAPVMVLRLDATMHVTGMNAHATRILGEATLGTPLHERLLPFSNPVELYEAAARPGHVHPVTLATQAGIPDTFLFRFVPMAGGMLALGAQDYPEQQRLALGALDLNRSLNNLTRELQQANAELQILNRQKTEFLGMAAHDLRRPLGILLSYSELLLDELGGTLGDDHREMLATCIATAGVMKRQIEDFLDVSIIESGHWHLETAPTRVVEILQAILSGARTLADRKHVRLRVRIPDGEPAAVQADPPQLQQVLANLLANAIEYSPPNREVAISARQEAGDWVFSVADQGPGIPAEAQARLFQPFARAGTRKTAGERSVGLGLAIARIVVQAHRGRIWIESIPGHGATFHVAIPASPPIHPKSVANTPAASASSPQHAPKPLP